MEKTKLIEKKELLEIEKFELESKDYTAEIAEEVEIFRKEKEAEISAFEKELTERKETERGKAIIEKDCHIAFLATLIEEDEEEERKAAEAETVVEEVVEEIVEVVEEVVEEETPTPTPVQTAPRFTSF